MKLLHCTRRFDWAQTNLVCLAVLCCVASFLVGSPSATASPSIGININEASDYNGEILFADAVKESREWTDTSGNVLTNIDSNGWPLQDAEVVVWAGSVTNMSGTYSLQFNGEATIAGATVNNQTYNSGTNLTTATLTMGNSDLIMTFTNTEHTSTSAVNTGIANLKIMRPTQVGGSTDYAVGTVFTTPIQNLVSQFGVVRFMDYVATNSNQQINWSDRATPSYYSYGYNVRATGGYDWQGRGSPWEYAVLFANLTNKDMWINVPEAATDTYVSNLANLILYGSDGTNPYTSTQSNPVFAPLNSNLKVYVEFSNEVWNTAGAFQQSEMNYSQAINEVNAGGSPLNFDGSASDWYWAARRSAKRTVEISNDFRNIFGSAAMMTRVRPVLESQEGYTAFWLLEQTHMLEDYYNNPTYVSNPEPPTYYIYGGGGSAYYNPNDTDTGLTLNGSDPIWTSETFAPAVWAPICQSDTDYDLAVYGQRIAYEGGPGMNQCGCAADTVMEAAWSDSRMTGIVTANQTCWNQNGGGLLVYYTSTHDWQFGFCQDIQSQSTPKLAAISQIDASTTAVGTYGVTIPSTLTAANYNAPASWAGANPSSMVASGAWTWVTYSVNTPSSGSFNIALSAGSSGTGNQADVYMDGFWVGTLTVANTGSNSSYQQTATVTTGALSAGTHAILIKAKAGSFGFGSVIVTSGTPTIPSAPTGLLATAGNAQASLGWSASNGATSYNVYRGTTAGGENSTPVATQIANTSYVNTGLTNNTTYYFKITAVDAAGTSGYSNEASATPNNTPPPAPTGLAGSPSTSQVTLTWNSVGAATSYNVYQGTTAGGEGATPVQSGIPTATATVIGLTNASTYYFKVAGVNSNGTGAQSNEASAVPQVSLPGGPGSLTSITGNAIVDLTWGAANGAFTYDVYRGTSAGGESATPIATGLTVTTYTNSGLTNGVTYYYKVAGVNTAGTGSLSNETSGTPAAQSLPLQIDSAGPAVSPFIADTDFVGGTDATNWTGAINTSGVTNPAPQAVYQTERWGNFTYTITDLSPGVSYTVRLHLCENYFTSSGSREFNVTINGTQVLTDFDIYATVGSAHTANVQQFTTTGDSGGQIQIGFAGVVNNALVDGIEILAVGPPSAPSGLVATAGDTQVTLGWSSGAGAASYNVYRGTASGGESATAISTGVTSMSYTNTGLTDGVTYYYKVTSVNSSGTSGYSNEASAKPAASLPGTPGTLAATPGNAQVALSWGSASMATSYSVYQGTSAGGEGATPVATGITSTSDTITGLTNGQVYYFKVAGVDANGTGSMSNEASCTPTAVNLILNPGFEQNIDWVGGGTYGYSTTNPHSGTYCGYEGGAYSSDFQNVSGLQGNTLYTATVWARLSATTPDSVTVYVSNFGGTTVTAAVTSTSWTQLTLTFTTGSGSTSCQVGIVDNNGSSITGYMDDWTLSAGGSSGPPSSPTGLTATPGNAQVTVAWSSSTGATSYNVLRSTVSGSGYAQVVNVSTTSYTNTGLTNGVTYYYVVAAVNGSGTSANSSQVSAAPSTASAAPTGLTATPGNTQVALSWSSSTGATSYNVLRSTVSGSGYAQVTNVTTTGYTNTGLTNGTTYYYVVAAVNTSGTSANSSQVSATPMNSVPPAPTGLTASPGNAQVTLGWTASSGATSYNVYRGTSSGGESGTALSSGITTTGYTDSAAVNGATYYYTVKALNSAGASGASNEASATPSSANLILNPGFEQNQYWVGGGPYGYSTTDPHSGTYCGYEGGSYGSFYENVSGLQTNTAYTATVWARLSATTSDSITVYVSNYGGNTVTAAVTSTTWTQLTLSFTTGSATTTCQVGIVDVNGSSVTGYMDDWYLAPTSSGPPSAPTGLTVTPGNGQAALSWSTSNGATSYNLLRSTVSGSGYAQVVNVSTTSYTNTGLTNGVTYYYVANAVNASGTSGYSNQVTVTPSAAPPAPTALTATGGNAQVALAWNASTGATSYNVYRGTSSGGESGTALSTGITTTSYTDTAVTNGTTYYYTVKALSSGGTSSSSNEASATPSTVTTVFSDGTFGSINDTNYTTGTNTVGQWYCPPGSNYATQATSGGNPGDYLLFGLWGTAVTVPLTAPSTAKTWTVSFDYLESAQSAPSHLTVFTMTSGQQILNGTIQGTQIFNQNLGTVSSWTHESYQVSVPSGANVIALEFYSNVGQASGIDNVLVTSN